MKTIAIEEATLDSCVREARSGGVVITRDGVPVALLVGLDDEQVRIGSDGEFWKLIAERRREATVDRVALNKALDQRPS